MSKVEGKKKVRRSAVDLLDAGLNLLAEHSIQQLTIDALCKQLCVTKGSFYHHFKGREDYLERMLEHWVNEWTIKSMNSASLAGESAAQRFDAIVEKSHDLPLGPETSIRSWALTDSTAQRYLEKVDLIRMDYLYEIFKEISGSHNRALTLSQISYSLFIGTRMIVPEIEDERHKAIIKLMKSEVYGMSEK
ncbi:TetR/AcrR family transcriptional regulator [Desulfovibrio sp. UCD-KL4C]|uniref:TetR/AcrR family transcriptional regulator n=1 Tax=Desulfovibrio sp. UCD-KL4C TaxID=2578120 RepID=UPI0025BD0476|nr:TetR/AcrR family transcriptional regulator [Desulfovibrio sp. UCD-KL4C]